MLFQTCAVEEVEKGKIRSIQLKTWLQTRDCVYKY